MTVYQLFGLFNKDGLCDVTFTEDEAKQIALRLSQRDNTQPVPVRKDFKIRPVFLVETDLTAHLLFSLKSNLDEAIKKLRKEEQKEKDALEEAFKTKTLLPPTYWEARHKAWLTVEALKRAVEALEVDCLKSFVNGK